MLSLLISGLMNHGNNWLNLSIAVSDQSQKLAAERFARNYACKRCGTYRTWIKEHQRGDATLGYVKKTYKVMA